MSQSPLYALYNKGLEKHFGLEFKEYAPVWKDIFHIEPTDKRYIQHQGYSGYSKLPGKRMPGERIQQVGMDQSFGKTYLIDNYGMGTSVTDEDMEDDLYGFYHRFIPAAGGEMARSFNVLMEKTTAGYFAYNGFAAGTSVPGMSDGRSLFSTSHPASLTNQNVSMANRPSVDVDLSIASVQMMLTSMRLQKAQNNLTVINNPARAVVIHPNQSYIARQIFKQDKERGTGDANDNYIKNDNIKIIEWAYFERSGAQAAQLNPAAFNAWFLLAQEHSLYFFMRQAFKSKSDYDVNTNTHIFASTARYGFGADDWRGTAGSPGQ